MRKRIGVIGQVVIGVGLGLLPALTAVSGRLILSGQADAIAAPRPAPSTQARPEIRVGGGELPHAGVPCRRSAADAGDAAPKAGVGVPKSGCNLRLVKRRPGDTMIWV